MRLVVEFDVPAVDKDKLVREWYKNQDAAAIVRDNMSDWGIRGFELDATEYVPGRRVSFNVAAAMEQDALKEEALNKVQEMQQSERGIKDTDNVGPGDIRDDRFSSIQRDEYSEAKHATQQNKDANDLDDDDYKKSHDKAQERQEKSVSDSSADFKDEGRDKRRHEDTVHNLDDLKADDKTDRTTAKASNKSEEKTQADTKK